MASAAPRPKGKILRIGIVQDRKIVQEQLIRDRQTVTVGESTKNTFVFPPCSLPKRFPVFVSKGSNYFLQFTEGMEGKVSIKGSVTELSEFRGRGDAVRRGGNWILPLTDTSRGKLSVDGISILFQFVPAPPEPLKGVVHHDFRPKLIEAGDPVFLSFLGLATALMGLFTMYAYTIEFPEISAEEIPDRFAKLLKPEKEEVEEVEVEETTEEVAEGEGEEAVEEEEEVQEVEKADEPEKPKETPEEKAAREALEQAKKQEELRAQLEDNPLMASLKLLGTTGDHNSGFAVDDPFADSDFVGQDLDAALAGVSGIEVASAAKLDVRGDGGGSVDAATIGDLKTGEGGSASVGGDVGVKVEGDVDLGTADLMGEGDEDAVRRVVRKYKGQIKYCYDKRLKENSDLGGRIEIEFSIARGRVLTASVFGNTTGDSALADCIMRKVKSWSFDKDVEMDVVYPFVLTK